jgi:hypothetical protein
VCLSLLGTWSGPAWVPGKSTLLQVRSDDYSRLGMGLTYRQVLISIQAMILCEEPYLNEPGWAESAGTPQSRACTRLAVNFLDAELTIEIDSANVRRMVVHTAVRDSCFYLITEVA